MRRIIFLVQSLLIPFLLFYAEFTTYSQNQRPAELMGLVTSIATPFCSMPETGGTVTCTNGGNTITIEVGNEDVARHGGFWFPKLQSGPTTLTYNNKKGDASLTVSFEMHPGTNLIFLDVFYPVSNEVVETVTNRIDQNGKEYTLVERRRSGPSISSPGWFLARHEGKYLLMETLWSCVQFGDNILKFLKSFKGVKSEYLQYGWGYRLDPTKVICQEQEWCLVVSEKK